MGCVLALDVGGKRTGLAISDEARIFAFPLETIETHQIITQISRLCTERNVEAVVMGMPKNLQNADTDNTARVLQTLGLIKKNFPHLSIFTVDERFTSKIAQQAMVAGGMKKKDRQKKENTDKLSATLILQSYLAQQALLKPIV